MNQKTPLLLGFILAAAAFFSLGQASRPAPVVGRYQLTPNAQGGAFVIDTMTGVVKPIYVNAGRSDVIPAIVTAPVEFDRIPDVRDKVGH